MDKPLFKQDDLVDRLFWTDAASVVSQKHMLKAGLCREAAYEIRRLREENARLREMLAIMGQDSV